MDQLKFLLFLAVFFSVNRNFWHAKADLATCFDNSLQSGFDKFSDALVKKLDSTTITVFGVTKRLSDLPGTTCLNPRGNCPAGKWGFSGKPGTSNKCGPSSVSQDLLDFLNKYGVVDDYISCCDSHDFCYSNCSLIKQNCEDGMRSCLFSVSDEQLITWCGKGSASVLPIDSCLSYTKLWRKLVILGLDGPLSCSAYYVAQNSSCSCLDNSITWAPSKQVGFYIPQLFEEIKQFIVNAVNSTSTQVRNKISQKFSESSFNVSLDSFDVSCDAVSGFNIVAQISKQVDFDFDLSFVPKLGNFQGTPFSINPTLKIDFSLVQSGDVHITVNEASFGIPEISEVGASISFSWDSISLSSNINIHNFSVGASINTSLVNGIPVSDFADAIDLVLDGKLIALAQLTLGYSGVDPFPTPTLRINDLSLFDDEFEYDVDFDVTNFVRGSNSPWGKIVARLQEFDLSNLENIGIPKVNSKFTSSISNLINGIQQLLDLDISEQVSNKRSVGSVFLTQFISYIQDKVTENLNNLMANKTLGSDSVPIQFSVGYYPTDTEFRIDFSVDVLPLADVVVQDKFSDVLKSIGAVSQDFGLPTSSSGSDVFSLEDPDVTLDAKVHLDFSIGVSTAGVSLTCPGSCDLTSQFKPFVRLNDWSIEATLTIDSINGTLQLPPITAEISDGSMSLQFFYGLDSSLLTRDSITWRQDSSGNFPPLRDFFEGMVSTKYLIFSGNIPIKVTVGDPSPIPLEVTPCISWEQDLLTEFGFNSPSIDFDLRQLLAQISDFVGNGLSGISSSFSGSVGGLKIPFDGLGDIGGFFTDLTSSFDLKSIFDEFFDLSMEFRSRLLSPSTRFKIYLYLVLNATFPGKYSGIDLKKFNPSLYLPDIQFAFGLTSSTSVTLPKFRLRDFYFSSSSSKFNEILLRILKVRLPDTFGSINLGSFNPNLYLPQIRFCFGFSDDPSSTSGISKFRLSDIDFSWPDISFNANILNTLKLKLPGKFANITLENFYPNLYLPEIQFAFGFSKSISFPKFSLGDFDSLFSSSTYKKKIYRSLNLSFPWKFSGISIDDFDPNLYLPEIQVAFGFVTDISLAVPNFRLSDLSVKFPEISKLDISSLTRKFRLGSLDFSFSTTNFKSRILGVLNTTFPWKFGNSSVDDFDPNFYLPEIQFAFGFIKNLSLPDPNFRLKDITSKFPRIPSFRQFLTYLKTRLRQITSAFPPKLNLPGPSGISFFPDFTFKKINSKNWNSKVKFDINIDVSLHGSPSTILNSIQSTFNEYVNKVKGIASFIPDPPALPLDNLPDELDKLRIDADLVLDATFTLDLSPFLSNSSSPRMSFQIRKGSGNIGLTLTNFSRLISGFIIDDLDASISFGFVAYPAAVSSQNSNLPATNMNSNISFTGSAFLDITVFTSNLPPELEQIIGNSGVSLKLNDTDLFDSNPPNWTLKFLVSPEFLDKLNSVVFTQLGDKGRSINSERILNAEIPVISRSLNDLLDNGSPNPPDGWGNFMIYDDIISDYRAECSPTNRCELNELFSRFFDRLKNLFAAATGINVRPILDDVNYVLTLEIFFDKNFHYVAPLGQLGNVINEPDIKFEISDKAEVNFAWNFSVGFTVKIPFKGSNGLFPSKDNITIIFDGISTSLGVDTQVPTIGITVGLIRGSVENAILQGNLGVTISPSKTQFNFGEISSIQFTLSKYGSLYAKFPFLIRANGLPDIFGATAELPYAEATVSDIFDFKNTANIVFHGLDDLLNWRGIDPITFFTLIANFDVTLGQVSSSELMDWNIPFTKQRIGGILDMVAAVTTKLTGPLVRYNTSPRSLIGERLSGTLNNFIGANNINITVQTTVNSTVKSVTIDLGEFSNIQTVEGIATILSDKIAELDLEAISSDNTIQIRTTDNNTLDKVTIFTGKGGKSLGFADGQADTAQKIPKFSDLESFIDLMNEFLPKGITVFYRTVLPGVRAFYFRIEFGYTLTKIGELGFDLDLAPLADISAQASVELGSDLNFDMEFGILFQGKPSNLTITGQLPEIQEDIEETDVEFNVTTTVGTFYPQNTSNWVLSRAINFSILFSFDNVTVNQTIFLSPTTTGNYLPSLEQALRAVLSPYGISIVVNATPGNTFTMTAGLLTKFGIYCDSETTDVSGLKPDLAKKPNYRPYFRNLLFRGSAHAQISDVTASARWETVEITSGSEIPGNGFLRADALMRYGDDPEEFQFFDEVVASFSADPFSKFDVGLNISGEFVMQGVQLNIGGFSTPSLSARVSADIPTQPLKLTKNISKPIVNVTSNLKELLNVRSLTPRQILMLFLSALDFLIETLDAANYPWLDDRLPLLSVTPREMMEFVEEWADALRDAIPPENAAANTLRKLELGLENALGLAPEPVNTTNCTGSCVIELVLNSDFTRLEFKIKLGKVKNFVKHLEIDVEEAWSMGNSPIPIPEQLKKIVDVNSVIDLHLAVRAGLDVGVAVDWSNRSDIKFLLVKGTGVSVQAKLDASVDKLEAALGPVQMSLNGAALFLNSTGIPKKRFSYDPEIQGASQLSFQLKEDVYIDESRTNGSIGIRSAVGIKWEGEAGFVARLVASFAGASADLGELRLELPNITKFLEARGLTKKRFSDGMYLAPPLDPPNYGIVPYSNSEIKRASSLSGIVNITFPKADFSNLANLFKGMNPLAALLNSPDTIINSLDSALTLIRNLLIGQNGVLRKVRVPLLGRAVEQSLAGADQGIGEFQEKMIRNLKNLVQSKLAEKDADITTASFACLVRQSLTNLFEDIGLRRNDTEVIVRDKNLTKLLYECKNTPQGANSVEWKLHVGKTYTPKIPPFELGINGLPLQLKLSGDIAFSVYFKLEFGFGIDVTNGFYVTNDTLFEIGTCFATSKSLDVRGQLFFFTVDAINNAEKGTQNWDGYCESVQSGSITGVAGKFQVAAKKGSSYQLTLPKLKQKPFGVGYLFDANVDLNITARIQGISWMPQFKSNFFANFFVGDGTLISSGQKRDISASAVKVLFRDNRLDASTLFANVLKPVFEKLADVTSPIVEVSNLLRKRIPGLSDMAGRDISLVTLPEFLQSGVFGKRIQCRTHNIEKYLAAIDGIVTNLKLLNSIANSGGILPIGEGPKVLMNSSSQKRSDWYDERGTGNDILYPDFEIRTPVTKKRSIGLRENYPVPSIVGIEPEMRWPDPEMSQKRLDTADMCNKIQNQKAKNMCLKLAGSPFEVPIIHQPSLFFKLITGEDIDLFIFKSPQFTFGFSFEFDFPIIGADMIKLVISGGVTLKAQIGFGFDTSGIRRAIQTGDVAYAAEGFYISDTYFTDTDVKEVDMTGFMSAYGKVNALLFRGGVGGRIDFGASIDLYDPNQDGKIRASELWAILKSNPFKLFNFALRAYVVIEVYFEWFDFLSNWKCCFYPKGSWKDIYRHTWGPYKLVDIDTSPDPPAPVARVTDAKGTLSLNCGSTSAPRKLPSTTGTFEIIGTGGAPGSEQLSVSYLYADGSKPVNISQIFLGISKIQIACITEGVQLKGVQSGIVAPNSIQKRQTLCTSKVLTFSFAAQIDAGVDLIVTSEGISISDAKTLFAQFGIYCNIDIILTNFADSVTILSIPTGTLRIYGLDAGDYYTVQNLDNNLDGFQGTLEIHEPSYNKFRDTLLVDFSTITTEEMSASMSRDTITFSLQNRQNFVIKYIPDVDDNDKQFSYNTQFYPNSPESVQILLGELSDTIQVISTDATTDEVLIYGNGGIDKFYFGNDTTNPRNSVLSLNAKLHKVGGDTSEQPPFKDIYPPDELYIFNGGFSGDRVSASFSSTECRGLQDNFVLQYSLIQHVEFYLGGNSKGVNFTLNDTLQGATTYIQCGDGNDDVMVYGVKSPTDLKLGNGRDILEVPVVKGNDTSTFINIINDVLRIDGEGGNDDFKIALAGAGESRIYVHNSDDDSSDGLFIQGTPADDLFLFRKTFVAMIHKEFSTILNKTIRLMEMIFYDTSIKGIIYVAGLEGKNTFAIDDNVGPTQLEGGSDSDIFYIGQMYNSPRNETAGLNCSNNECFDTYATTEGYLSVGCSFPVTCNGNDGDDTFNVLHNRASLDLNGGPGQDSFSIRAFALVGDPLHPPTSRVSGGDGNDKIEYAMNAPVDIDGGAGVDTLICITTDGNDEMVMTSNGIYGAGLFITFVNIESVRVVTIAGNDTIAIYGTNPTLSTELYLGKGQDVAYVSPSFSSAVSSNDLRGHNGLITHAISSDNFEFNGINVRGISTNVYDADDFEIMLREITTDRILYEDHNHGQYKIEYYVHLSHKISTGSVQISITATQPPNTRTKYIDVKSETETIEHVEGRSLISFNSSNWNSSVKVTVTILDDSEPEGIIDVTIMHSATHTKCGSQCNYNFVAARMLPIRMVDKDKAYLAIQPIGGNSIVSEGSSKTELQMNVIRYPCTPTPTSKDVTIFATFPRNQLAISPNNFKLSAINCIQTIQVTAPHDGIPEGFHFDDIHFEITDPPGNSTYSDPIMDFNVQIIDIDAPGVVIHEPLGAVDIIEAGDDIPSVAIWGYYTVRLASNPGNSNVTVVIKSEKTETSKKITDPNRQVKVCTSRDFSTCEFSLSVDFSQSDWSTEKKIWVFGIHEGIVDGAELQVFPPNPSQAQGIQGPFTISGGDDPQGSGVIPKPEMQPGEIDATEYICNAPLCIQFRKNREVDESTMIDSLTVFDNDNYRKDFVVIQESQLDGLGMGPSRTLMGLSYASGIVYLEFEVFTLELGPADHKIDILTTCKGITTVTCNRGIDTVVVTTAQGILNLDLGSADDNLTVLSVQTTETSIRAGPGDDVLLIPRRFGSDGATENVISGILSFDGEDGTDVSTLYLANSGRTVYNIRDSGNDVKNGRDNSADRLYIFGTDKIDKFLLRKQFFALISDLYHFERINYDEELNGGIEIHAQNENDIFAFDDNSAIMAIYGDEGDDIFLCGQLYFTPRDSSSGIAVGDEFQDVQHVTLGYLSRGNTYPVSISGGNGHDNFFVLRNFADLNLDGDAGNDEFTVRSFKLAAGENSTADSNKLTTVNGGAGDDLVRYTSNANLKMDGGDGYDTAAVIGTEDSDHLVISDGTIYGLGRAYFFINIEYLRIATLEGDDVITLISTAPGYAIQIIGGAGSDHVRIAPRSIGAIVVNDLLGHSGVIQHTVSEISDYDTWIDGVSVNVADIDSDGIFFYFDDNHLQIYEDALDGPTNVTYHVVLTKQPEAGIPVIVTTTVFPDEGLTRVSQPVIFNSNDWNIPKPITISAISGASVPKDSIHEVQHSVTQVSGNSVGSYDQIRAPSFQLRRIDSSTAKIVVTSLENVGPLVVTEGSSAEALRAKFNVQLVPCTVSSQVVEVSISSSVPNQLEFSETKFSLSQNSKCSRVIEIYGKSDGISEGFHFVDVLISSGNSIPVDGALLSVKIGDYESPGVIVTQNQGQTHVIENDSDNFSLNLREDFYFVRLTGPPSGDVHIDVTPINTSTQNYKFVEVTTNTSQLKFDQNNWMEKQAVLVRGIKDGKIEGQEIKHFADRTSLIKSLQGSVEIIGNEISIFSALGVRTSGLPNLILWGNETDGEKPPPASIPGLLEAIDSEQADVISIFDLDNYGDAILDVTFDGRNTRVTGLGMGGDRDIGKIVPGGITISGFEMQNFYLGPANDTVLIQSTSPATHKFFTKKGNDVIRAKKIGGHVIVDAGAGNDQIFVGNDENRVTDIDALFVAIGGSGFDRLNIDDSSAISSTVSWITRSTITGLNLIKRSDIEIPFIQTVSISSNGKPSTGTPEFTLSITIPIFSREDYFGNCTITSCVPIRSFLSEKTYEVTLPLDATEVQIARKIQATIFPPYDDNENDPRGWSCGILNRTKCAFSVNVTRIDDVLLIQYQGQFSSHFGPRIGIVKLSTTDDHIGEFVNVTNIDVLPRNEGINYYSFETVDVHTGSVGDTFNVRGTRAVTTIHSRDGDDRFYVSSMADLPSDLQITTDFLPGNLDYVEGVLNLDSGIGRHTLMISDESTIFGKPRDLSKTVTLSNSSLTGACADINYFTQENFLDGITVWLGDHDDSVSVVSTHNSIGRTITTLNTGDGSDTVTVTLFSTSDGFFVLNTEQGDDIVQAENSTLPLIIFGGLGADTISSGSSGDFVIGDVGHLIYTDVSGNYVTVIGGGGPGDKTDGIVRPPRFFFSESNEQSGDDVIFTNDGDDFVIAGEQADQVNSGSGKDVVIGDLGKITFDPAITGILSFVETANCTTNNLNDVITTGTSSENDNDIVLGGSGSDRISTGGGNDHIIGDCGYAEYEVTTKNLAKIISTDSEIGGDDIIRSSSGRDIIISGFGNDVVDGGDDNDVIFGDNGEIINNNITDFPILVSTVDVEFGGDDSIDGGDGINTIFGGTGNDNITTGSGADLIFGDHGISQYYSDVNSGFKLITAYSIRQCVGGGNDTISSGSGDDIVIGGSYSDSIFGEDGQDIILGDYGLIDTRLHPEQIFLSISTSDRTCPGSDYIEGGLGDDRIMGQQGSDTIYGHSAKNPTVSSSDQDDIWGGHNVLYGDDEGDFIYGSADADFILGDNGWINRTVTSTQETIPFPIGLSFNLWPASPAHPGVFDKVKRIMQRFDDVDVIQGDDTIYGNDGDDIIHGQRGNDIIYGGPGNDELYGELGSDTIYGGDDHDTILGDVGFIIRLFDSSGYPLLNPKTNSWKQDIILEEVGLIDEQIVRISSKVTDTESLIEKLIHSDIVFLCGALLHDEKCANYSSYWDTALIFANLAPPYDDRIEGGEGDDIIFGQRGNDFIRAGDGEDLVFGDFAISQATYRSDIPYVLNTLRYLAPVDPTRSIFHHDFFGNSVGMPIRIVPEDFITPLSSIHHTSLGTIVPNYVLRHEREFGIASFIPISGDCPLKPIASVITDVLHHKDVLPGNDVLDGGKGSDLIVGDIFFSELPIDLYEAFPNTLGIAIDAAYKRISSIQRQMEGLSQDYTLWAYASKRPNAITQAKIVVGNDTISGGIGSDIISGDDLTLIGGTLDDRVFLHRELLGHVTKLYHLYRDVEWIFSDFEAVLYESHQNILGKLQSVNFFDGNNVPSNKLYIGQDVISGDEGSDMIFGDYGYFVDVGIIALNSEQPQHAVSILREITKILRHDSQIRDQKIRDHVISDLNASRSVDPNTMHITEDPFIEVFSSSDEIVADNDDDGDFISGEVGIIGIGVVSESVFANSTQKFVRDDMVNFFGAQSWVKSYLVHSGYAVPYLSEAPDAPFAGFMYHSNYQRWKTRIPDPRKHNDIINGGLGDDIISGYILSGLMAIIAENSNKIDDGDSYPYFYFTPEVLYSGRFSAISPDTISPGPGNNIIFTQLFEDKFVNRTSKDTLLDIVTGVPTKDVLKSIERLIYNITASSYLTTYNKPLISLTKNFTAEKPSLYLNQTSLQYNLQTSTGSPDITPLPLPQITGIEGTLGAPGFILLLSLVIIVVTIIAFVVIMVLRSKVAVQKL